MKRVNGITLLCFCITAGVLSLHFLGHEAFAAEKSSSWRPTYDLILRWINFGIIVFVLNKYAKAPLMNFLRGQKEKLAKEIKKLDDKKENVAANIKETQKVIDVSEVRFAELKERIVQQGQRKKQEIIESAHQQSKMMLKNARRRIGSQFDQAKSAFSAELIDTAIELAMQRLPQEVTDEDHDKFLDQYLASKLSD